MLRRLLFVAAAGWSLLGFAAEPERAAPPFRVAAVQAVKLNETAFRWLESWRGK
jgi:hypothetical protein